MKSTRFLAVDLGASSGRVAEAVVSGTAVTLAELHRFSTPSYSVDGTLHWDLGAIVDEISEGVRRSSRLRRGAVSIGIDTWGVDYGLLDSSGALLVDPVHHRDARTKGRADELDSEFVYDQTGVLPQDINTLTQLRSESPGRLEAASTLLFMPDLVAHCISGVAATDVTIASTSQLIRPDGTIAADVLHRYGVPDLLPSIVQPGTPLGPVTGAFAQATGWSGLVTTVAGHDTACAVAALPAAEPVAFISCGTWGLVGLALPHPVISQAARQAGFTNEVGVGSHHLIRNASGLWLLNECIRSWSGDPRTYAPELAAAAEQCPPFESVIDPLDPTFLAPGDMPRRIADYCAAHDQPVPRSRAQVVRCILDSLALGFASGIIDAVGLTGITPATVRIVGGGSRIRLLCSTVATLLGVPVVAGPSEASLIGNVMVQALAHGAIGDRDQARDVLAASTDTVTHVPSTSPLRADALDIYHGLVRAGTAAS